MDFAALLCIGRIRPIVLPFCAAAKTAEGEKTVESRTDTKFILTIRTLIWYNIR